MWMVVQTLVGLWVGLWVLAKQASSPAKAMLAVVTKTLNLNLNPFRNSPQILSYLLPMSPAVIPTNVDDGACVCARVDV